ncbi:MAG: glycogen synthase [Proteobacteria bacterium]|nr:glycogen synthase [Pseudomonadota bacterium]
MSLHVLLASPEVAPLSGANEVGEQTAALARGLRERGLAVSVVAPSYGTGAEQRFGLARRLIKLPVALGAERVELGVLQGTLPQTDAAVYLLDHPAMFHREPHFGPYADDYRRAFLFAAGVVELVRALGLKPQVVHAHDWAAGLLPLLLRRPTDGIPLLADTAVVFTLHDASQLGLCAPGMLAELHLPADLNHPDALEFYGQISLLKAGLVFADAITVPSPSFAAELQQEGRGGGLHGLYAARRLRLAGIACGIDEQRWAPGNDHTLAMTFDAAEPDGKAQCKEALQLELGLPVHPTHPLLIVGGPQHQLAGAELMLETAPQWLGTELGQELQVVFLGEAPAEALERIARLVAEAPRTVAYRPWGGDEFLRRALAGADVLVLPAPSASNGLLALKALRYGAVPLAHATGGLRDHLVDFDLPSATGTSILFDAATATALLHGMRRMLALFSDQRRWRRLRQNAMRQRVGWNAAVARYEQLYRQLLDLPQDQPQDRPQDLPQDGGEAAPALS